MLINELSKRTGISIHTIRFYEKSGLIKGKRQADVKTNNYFHYEEEAILKLELIRDAKSIGFSLSEIGKLMDAWFNQRMTTPEKLSVLDEKLLSIEEKIRQLKGMKKLIAKFKEEVLSEEECRVSKFHRRKK